MRVCRLNLELQRNGLVAMTSGNVSGIDRDLGAVVIKPSGVPYRDLSADQMVVVDLEGGILEGDLTPSSDTATHLYMYRRRPDFGGIVHTHSPYAVAFAIRGEPVPCYSSAMADEFGDVIPVADYGQVGGEEIGSKVTDAIGDSPAVLVRNHGPFCVGRSPEAALKTAVMLEDTLKSVHLALQLGEIRPLSAEVVARAHARYVSEYGQR